MSTAKSVEVLSKAIRDDPDFAHTWFCTFAMAAFEEGTGMDAANRIGARLMFNVFGVKKLKFDRPDNK